MQRAPSRDAVQLVTGAKGIWRAEEGRKMRATCERLRQSVKLAAVLTGITGITGSSWSCS
jgi:hypothetical protein